MGFVQVEGLLSDLASEWHLGKRGPCFETDLTAFVV